MKRGAGLGMKLALLVMKKDVLLLWREPQALFFTIGFPLVFGVFFGAIYSSSEQEGANVPVVVADLDGSPSSAAFVRSLGEDEHIAARVLVDEAAVRSSVRRGAAAAGVVIGPGFGETVSSLVPGGLAGEEPARPVMIVTDPSQSAGSGIAVGAVHRAVVELRGRALAGGAVGANGDEANGWWSAMDPRALVRVEAREMVGPRPANAYEITFAQSIVWVMMGCAASFAVSLVREREAGTIVRLRLAPGGVWMGLLGKALACVACSSVVAFGFAGLGAAAFGVSAESWPLLAGAITAGAACFGGLMMLLAVIARGHASPGQLAWGVLLVLAITGGGMLPLAFMPGWLSAVSVASPVRWSILAVEGAVWREFGWAEAAGSLSLLWALGVGAFVLGGAALVRDGAGD